MSATATECRPGAERALRDRHGEVAGRRLSAERASGTQITQALSCG
jgi:hypothetical protein